MPIPLFTAVKINSQFVYEVNVWHMAQQLHVEWGVCSTKRERFIMCMELWLVMFEGILSEGRGWGSPYGLGCTWHVIEWTENASPYIAPHSFLPTVIYL